MFKQWLMWKIDESGFGVSLYTNFLIRRLIWAKLRDEKLCAVPPTYPGLVMGEYDSVIELKKWGEE